MRRKDLKFVLNYFQSFLCLLTTAVLHLILQYYTWFYNITLDFKILQLIKTKVIQKCKFPKFL